MKASKQITTRLRVATGVYKLKLGNYEVRKMIDGDRVRKLFTNKAKAIKYYNNL